MPSLADHLASLLRLLWKVLMAPLWFFDRVDKEKAVLAVPPAVRRRMLKLMFGPTLAWTMLLHRAMPDQRRWYDRVDERLILGALPLEKSLESLARVERVSGVLNMCDEFDGHASYGRLGITQLRLPTMDYCSPSAQQVENGLDFIRKQPPGGTVYCHCKAGRGRAGAPVRAATRTPGVADPALAVPPGPCPAPVPGPPPLSCNRLLPPPLPLPLAQRPTPAQARHPRRRRTAPPSRRDHGHGLPHHREGDDAGTGAGGATAHPAARLAAALAPPAAREAPANGVSRDTCCDVPRRSRPTVREMYRRATYRRIQQPQEAQMQQPQQQAPPQQQPPPQQAPLAQQQAPPPQPMTAGGQWTGAAGGGDGAAAAAGGAPQPPQPAGGLWPGGGEN